MNRMEELLNMRRDFRLEAFGENTYFFTPQDDPKQVQNLLDQFFEKQEKNQFGEERISVYFFPGNYAKEISVRVGFYTQVSGLGIMPEDTVLRAVNCDASWNQHDSKNNGTCNFWRGVENITIDGDAMWAVSQATYMRRMHIKGNLALHHDRGWVSGGFLANTKVDGVTDSGTQQQWLSRNCSWDSWTGQNWNLVFAGVPEEGLPEGRWPEKPYTVVEKVPIIREKPFLAFDPGKGLGICVPETRVNAVDVDWTPGNWIPMEQFYIAKPDKDSAATLNQALKEGQHLFFTPGIYELNEPLVVNKRGRILLGTGLATLRSAKGKACVEVVGDTRVTIAGLLIDAGTEPTEELMIVGSGNRKNHSTEKKTDAEMAAEGFTLLEDLFFRVGGAAEYDTEVETCLTIAQDEVLGDHFWIWRADHSHGVGWNRNKAARGLWVTGNNVTIYALMVEHFREYQTLWEGENGRMIFYQSEIPYDVPRQEEWRSHGGKVNGYASYKVGDQVQAHEAWGLGIYLFNRDAEVELHSAMEVPRGAEKIRIHNVCSVMITGLPGITHVINETGGAVTTFNAREVVLEYDGK